MSFPCYWSLLFVKARRAKMRTRLHRRLLLLVAVMGCSLSLDGGATIMTLRAVGSTNAFGPAFTHPLTWQRG